MNQPRPLNPKFKLLPASVLLLLLITGCGKAPAPDVAADAPATPPESVTTPRPAPVEPPVPAPIVAADATVVEAVPAPSNSVAGGDTVSKPMVEEQIIAVTSSGYTSREKAAELFKMFAQLDPQGQRKVALAAVQQVDDADYALIRTQLLDPKLDPRVLSVLMTDTLKRKNSIKLPVLLELAQIDGHPLQVESRELLAALLQKNYGTNWTKWEEAVTTQLAENPN